MQAAGLALVAGVGIAYLSTRQQQQARTMPCSDLQCFLQLGQSCLDSHPCTWQLPS